MAHQKLLLRVRNLLFWWLMVKEKTGRSSERKQCPRAQDERAGRKRKKIASPKILGLLQYAKYRVWLRKVGLLLSSHEGGGTGSIRKRSSSAPQRKRNLEQGKLPNDEECRKIQNSNCRAEQKGNIPVKRKVGCLNKV